MVGTVIFVLVFMLALGSLAYQGGLQQQAGTAQQQQLQVQAQRGSETVAIASTPSGLVATNEGPTTAVLNHLMLRYPNGTVYSLTAAATMASGGQLTVAGLVPARVCSPGTATCLSRFNQIVSGNPPGSSVGLVTSRGNAFWYAFQGSQATAQSVTVWAKTPVTTTGTGVYSSTSLSVSLSSGSYAFYVFTAIEPMIGLEKFNFEVHALPLGASLVVACAPMSYPIGGGNQPTNCVTSAGTPIAAGYNLGFGVPPPVFSTPGIFGVVTIGSTPGTLQIDAGCLQYCGSITVLAGSFMVVQPLG